MYSPSAFFVKKSVDFYIGNATASLYSFCNIDINSFKPSRASDLCVQSTQEKLSVQSKGVQANWLLWSFKKPGARPELTSYLDSIDDYDTVILAYPNYWSTMPMAVFTFLERYDFSGKTILPLCTNEGSGMGHSESDIKKLAPGAAVKKGLAITGSNAANAGASVKKWLSANGLI